MSFAPESFVADAAIPRYRVVKITGNRSVAFATATTDKIIGITENEATAAGKEVSVKVAGVAKLQFNDSCAAGALVTVNASGLGVAVVAANLTTTGIYVIGRLIGPALTGAGITGTVADVLIQPMQVQVNP